MKKLLLIFLVMATILCLLIGCNGVTPPTGEGEGEGEGEEEVSRVVLVELFNAEGCANCAIMEPILEEIAVDPAYGHDKMILVEEAGFGVYSTPETRARYKWYLPNSEDRKTPNILFNGLNQKIHIYAPSNTIKSIIATELNKEVKIKISAQRNTDATSTIVSGTVTNISSSDLNNLVVTLMTYKDRGMQGFRYSVNNILTEEIGSLTSADTYSFSFTVDEPYWVANGIHGAVLVQETASSKKEVLQVLYVD